MLKVFISVLATVFVAEMGDKTQLMLFALSAKYRLKDIFLGTAAAILVLNALAVCVGGLLNAFLSENLYIVKAIAAVAFFAFSISSIPAILSKESAEEESKHLSFSFAPLAIFCTFFLAELGDKTQLASITFGAANGLNKTAFVIWIAASTGLFLADAIGLLALKMLGGKIPSHIFNALAFALFAVFGFLSLKEAHALFTSHSPFSKIPALSTIMIFSVVIFLIFCALTLLFQKRKDFKKVH